MKHRLYGAAVAVGVLAACAVSHRADAAVITFTQDQVTVPADFITAPTASTGNFMLSTSGSPTGQSVALSEPNIPL